MWPIPDLAAALRQVGLMQGLTQPPSRLPSDWNISHVLPSAALKQTVSPRSRRRRWKPQRMRKGRRQRCRAAQLTGQPLAAHLKAPQ